LRDMYRIIYVYDQFIYNKIPITSSMLIQGPEVARPPGLKRWRSGLLLSR
jgi:hypothetical protein